MLPGHPVWLEGLHTDGKDERIKRAEKHIHAVNATKPEKETQGNKELILHV